MPEGGALERGFKIASCKMWQFIWAGLPQWACHSCSEGQKQIGCAIDSPKKRKDKFVLFAILLFRANKSNSSLSFSGESMAHQSVFQFYLTFSMDPLHIEQRILLSFHYQNLKVTCNRGNSAYLSQTFQL